ncbi:hypothetical protein [Alienimonas californiensis]|uniref:IgA FC receptor n=1 Tax=Alienimonas californiensis TaxID=2527989 RepID=A0A517P7B7_9PLAN|nr:hypothetical protein [Alienimonas californiensis]QDT15264.1 hypothetical protein CA12_13470 [Alienimonas californiensis]
MGTLFRLPPALLAALPLLMGPAAWATDCGAGGGCVPSAEAACACGPPACHPCCDAATDAATPAAAPVCACWQAPAEPLAPVAPTTDPAPAPTALGLPPSPRIAAVAPNVLRSSPGTPPPAAGRSLRAWLCVWRI